MPGEMDLNKLLQNMEPKLNKDEFVFCTLESLQGLALDPLCIFREEEGVTVILSKAQADEIPLPYSGIYSWITLTVHSSLDAVGLTAAVSKALAEANISCNMVAAYYHDHIFVPIKDSQQAMSTLINLSKQEKP